MKIGVDLDDVLVQLLVGLDKYHNDIYKTELVFEDHKDFNLSKVWNCSDEEMKKRVYDFYRSDYTNDLIPLDGAVKAIDRLSKNNELILITSRSESIKDRTIEWIEKYFPKKFSKIFFTSQFDSKKVKKTKGDLCVELGISLMIEDHLEYACECAGKNIEVLLMNKPYNQNVNLPLRVKRVFDWKEIENFLVKNI
jgi:uncharacterized HAD superfamily protein